MTELAGKLLGISRNIEIPVAGSRYRVSTVDTVRIRRIKKGVLREARMRRHLVNPV